MLSLSGILDEFSKYECFKGRVIYGDPGYGCSEYVCCPFPSPTTAAKATFNARMSRVQEAVEWGLCRVKVDWSFVN
ncbi:hypothetical protein PR002_g13701 [Phytophthora rubi]|uniref:DDE Tnp4 domain-containing protein n=1 Tax=Phytophthora rubi TaxID=129364 RepID=A0A6A3LCA2_9STRA|nr:hypothetical protein PR002_g13701 [Phytophthora rubi]